MYRWNDTMILMDHPKARVAPFWPVSNVIVVLEVLAIMAQHGWA